jgi:hypothetical protein
MALRSQAASNEIELRSDVAFADPDVQVAHCELDLIEGDVWVFDIGR